MDIKSWSHKAVCRFQVASWDEKLLSDIDGEGTTVGEAYYPSRGIYRGGDDLVLGLERFTGTVDGHEGSCVLRHTGSHGGGSVRGHVEVVPGMGTGALADLRGEAELLIAGHSDDGYELVLHYDLS